MIRFELRLGKDGFGVIQVRTVAKGINTKVTTGIKVKAKEWSTETQSLKHPNDLRPVASLGGMSYSELSERLLELRRVLDVVDRRGEVCKDVIKRYVTDILLEKACNRTVDNKKCSFVRFFEQYINEMKDGTRTKAKTHEKVRGYYYKQYITVKKKVEQYQREKNTDIGWDSLTKTFFDKFCVFLQEQGKRRNTVSHHTRLLSIVVKEAERRGLVTCTTNVHEWNVTQEVVDNKVSLSQQQLNALFHANFENRIWVNEMIDRLSEEDRIDLKFLTSTKLKRKNIQETVNIFLLCCFTGQRFSDYTRLTEDCVCELSDGREYILLKQQKTGHELYIPLDPRAKSVMQRKIRTTSQCTINRIVKIAGHILGWTDDVAINEERSGIKYVTHKKFYELLQSHTARRTFASLAYLRGVNLQAIMAVTGHKSEKMLKRYIRVEKEERAMMASRELFKLTPIKEVN